MHDIDDQSCSSFATHKSRRPSVASQLSQLKELAKLRKQHILSEDEFVDLKKNILYGDGGGFGAGGGGWIEGWGGRRGYRDRASSL